NLLKRSDDPDIRSMLDREREAFRSNVAFADSRKSLLRERISCFREQIKAYETQARSKAREIALIENELDGTRALREKNLVPITKLTELERDEARLEGEENGWLVASIAEAKGKIAEIEMQMLQADQEHRREIDKELKDAAVHLRELDRSKIAVEGNLKQAEIRAARSGIIDGALLRTVGEVVYPGDEIMRILPRVAGVAVEAKIAADELSRLRVGQAAELQFPSHGRAGAPVIRGMIAGIEADAANDRQSSRRYTAQVVVPPQEAARLGPLMSKLSAAPLLRSEPPLDRHFDCSTQRLNLHSR
ncbi:MAG: HlyD family efflux transporter periplasmic adaptor subunit, partial [Bradyrhizobium sp.]